MNLVLCFQLIMSTIFSPQERERVLASAALAFDEQPETIVTFPASRSAGGIHDYFSEGDYWWPNPLHPDSPYVKRDGFTNPKNFISHRQAVTKFSIRVSTLVAAFRLTGDFAYAQRALLHLNAWFVDEPTRMNPHLLYGQAIKGRVTGRGIGIIDTIHLIEVAQSVRVLVDTGAITHEEAAPIIAWFREYLRWMTTHEFGRQEREARNNHGTWWVAQVATFATLVGDTALLDSCRERYRTVLLPGQVAGDGSFPLELERTKPFVYSLFNLEGMALICHLLSKPGDELWLFALPDGRSLQKAFEHMAPYVRDKSTWPHTKDVMNFDMLPVRQMAWLFGGQAFADTAYIALWKGLDSVQREKEVVRAFAIREPLLWFE